MHQHGAAEVPIEEQIADIVYRIRHGDRVVLEWADGCGGLLVGSKLTAEIAERLERGVGIRKIDNEDGSVGHVAIKD